MYWNNCYQTSLDLKPGKRFRSFSGELSYPYDRSGVPRAHVVRLNRINGPDLQVPLPAE